MTEPDFAFRITWVSAFFAAATRIFMMCCVSILSAGQKKIRWLTSLLFGRIFGRGAKAVQAIIRLCEACLDGRVPIDEAGMYLMEHIDKKRIYALYDEALDAA